MITAEYVACGNAGVFQKESQNAHGDNDGYMFGFPFFMKDPCKDECGNDVIGGEPYKGGVQRWDDEARDTNTIDDGDEGDEAIFYIIHADRRFFEGGNYDWARQR